MEMEFSSRRRIWRAHTVEAEGFYRPVGIHTGLGHGPGLDSALYQVLLGLLRPCVVSQEKIQVVEYDHHLGKGQRVESPVGAYPLAEAYPPAEVYPSVEAYRHLEARTQEDIP